MSTFLQVSGVLFWLSLGAGGLWVGLCAFVDWLRRPKKHSPPVLILESHPIGKRIVNAWQFSPMKRNVNVRGDEVFQVHMPRTVT